ncbi:MULTISPECIES: HAD-IIIA family hydrolase [unclassified Massilia]|uniref:D-glycero-alpha-D-manno-heptose-1,7-bisphosphate 7-phosphatase n=1 Tax=unclassified Massilia TaxID=2609279 RepID=UPI0017807B7E|nr:MULTISPECIES: HAD-IIIA family hydrolase [unclassified Massilia]MBD8530263.1 HAD-IIIA family hydrolase [Massilia sp. CFBP 13647]MBD8673040.1 HAD-IIIA family hydrolase [Massilia sp. CFBP 13721]
MKAIFLDKDGALVDNLPQDAERRAERRLEPRRIRLSSGAGPALRLLARLDYRFFVVCNQACIAQGRLPEAAMHGVSDRLTDLLFRENLSLDGFYYCPHDPLGSVAPYAVECHCRKPLPGLLLKASFEHGIDLRASWMIGNVLHDVEAGNRAGCRTVLLDNGVETEWRLGPRRIPTRMAPDLYAAAVLIAGHQQAPDNDDKNDHEHDH